MVTVSATALVREALTSIQVETYDPDESDADGGLRQGGFNVYPLSGDDARTLPFSLGVTKGKKDKFLLVVTGFRDGERAIEQKGMVTFQAHKSLEVRIELRKSCLDNLCDEEPGGWFENTCHADRNPVCGAVEELPVTVIEHGDELLDADLAELDPLDAATRDGGLDARPLTPEAGPDVDAEPEPASDMDAAPDADAAPLVDASPMVDADAAPSCEAGACLSQTSCGPGQYVSKEPSASSDRVCAACEAGSFSATDNAPSCALWRECDRGRYVSSAPTAQRDRECADCPADTISTTPNQAMCLPASACQPGSVQTAPATSSSPAECASCAAGTYCAGGLAPSAGCDGNSWDHDQSSATPCSARTTCVPGQYAVNNGSATSNRICAPCGPNSYSTQSNVSSCRAWSTCAGGALEVKPGTSTSDRVCGAAWTRLIGTASNETIYGLAVGADLSVYAAGYTQGALVAGAQGGGLDAFVRKYDAAGTEQWTRQIGTSGGDFAWSVGADAAGNVYVGGYSSGPLGTDALAGGDDAFLRKYDAAGTLQWTRQFGSSTNDEVHALVVDGSANVWVVGQTSGTQALAGQAFGGNSDAFVRKYNGAGSVLWTSQLGTSANDRGMGVALDANGDAVVTGYTLGTMSGSSAGDMDVFVRRYSSAGVPGATFQFGTSAADGPNGIALDGSGNIYVAGNTRGALFGQTHTPDTNANAFVSKFDAGGTHQWTRLSPMVGNNSDAYGVAVDASGNAFIAGYIAGYFNPDPGVSGDGKDFFWRRYDAAGNLTKTQQLGTDGYDQGLAVRLDAQGALYLSGCVGNTFASQPYAGGTDGVVIKLFP